MNRLALDRAALSRRCQDGEVGLNRPAMALACVTHLGLLGNADPAGGPLDPKPFYACAHIWIDR